MSDFFLQIIENVDSYLKIFSYFDANPLVAGLLTRVEDWLNGRFHVRVIGFEDIMSSTSLEADWP